MKTVNEELCKECGGRCCMNGSCLYGPEDFKEISVANFLRLYEEGKIMFSYVPETSDEETGWLVRPAQIDTERIQINIFSGNSQCINLKKNGCEIKDYYHRPRGAKLLIPKKLSNHDYGEDCKSYYDANKALEDWKPFQYIIKDTVYHILAEKRRTTKEFLFDHEVCTKCGGRCCSSCGCAFSPKDFKEISFSFLKRIMDRGFVSIVPISHIQTGLKKDVLTLKVRNLGSDVIEFEAHIARPCILWDQKTGCFFDDNDRPYGGKSLAPTPNIGCIMGYSFRQRAIDWLPYQEILEKLGEFYYEKNIPFEGII